MARGVNKVILVGNLGADPETRSMPSGMTVTNIRIATSESWKDKASGAQQERTEWHSIALFGRLGEIAAGRLRPVLGAGARGRKRGLRRRYPLLAPDACVYGNTWVQGRAGLCCEKVDQGSTRHADTGPYALGFRAGQGWPGR